MEKLTDHKKGVSRRLPLWIILIAALVLGALYMRTELKPKAAVQAKAGALAGEKQKEKTADSQEQPKEFDFVTQGLSNAEGFWESVSSEVNRKWFHGSYVYEYTEYPEASGLLKLQRISVLEGMGTIPGKTERDGWVFVLNTGNKYYMYADQPDYLECHWDPDGYSGSDSLYRVETPEARAEIRTFSGVGLEGTVSKFTGWFGGSETEECYALNLSEPHKIEGEQGSILVLTVQLNGNFDKLEELAESGRTAVLYGDLWEAYTAHHYTDFLMTVDKIK